jgi:hypothetical protein
VRRDSWTSEKLTAAPFRDWAGTKRTGAGAGLDCYSSVFELMVLLCRSPRSKELGILVLRHELSIMCRQVQRPRLRQADRLLLTALSRALPGTPRRLLSQSADAPALAPTSGRPVLDVPASAAVQATSDRSRGAGPGALARTREPNVRLSAHRW